MSYRSHALNTNAVVVVPGIMGSELYDTELGRQVWGLSDPRWYVDAWSTGRSLDALKLSNDERRGVYGRIRATRAIRFPAFAPILSGFEPYSRLISEITKASVDQRAVAEFPYDWRLPVAHNARQLESFCANHLRNWRQLWLAQDGFGMRKAQRRPGLIVIGHSMGGVLAREVLGRSELGDEITSMIALGAPFYGAPKAVQMLSSGRGLPIPLPHRRVKVLACTLPAIYDLLPTYRCVIDNTDPRQEVARKVTAGDLAAIGADPEHSDRAIGSQAPVSLDDRLDKLIQVVGCEQATTQSLAFDDGEVVGFEYTLESGDSAALDVVRTNRAGDGTVPRVSAEVPGGHVVPLGNTHGALASSEESMLLTREYTADRPPGPWQGGRHLGIRVPDTVSPLAPFKATVLGDFDPAFVTCRVVDISTGLPVEETVPQIDDGGYAATIGPLAPGLYRISIDGSSFSPVTQMVLCERPT